MIEVEIRTPSFNEESQEIAWECLARVRVVDREMSVGGDESVVPWSPVMSLALGKPVHPREDPEEWTRGLPHAYRSGDLVAVVIRDDALPVDLGEVIGVIEPDVPNPSALMHEHDDQACGSR